MATKAIVGEKVGMTQVWDDQNRVVPVTVVQVAPVPGRPGQDPRERRLQRAAGHLRSEEARTSSPSPRPATSPRPASSPGPRLVELRLDDVSGYEVGQEISVDLLADGDRIDVTAVSKGKGFAGVMKRHGFSGQKASHGAHRIHRAPGAIGACATPSRVFKGQRMAGRMGGEKVTTLNLTVVQADAERDLLLVKGAVPGPKGGLVLIRDAVKANAAGRSGLMATVDVHDANGQEAGSVDLDDAIFGIEPNVPVMHQVVTAQLAARRAGTQSTKTRAEVARRRRQAVEAEGHRPRPPGLDPLAAVARRRRGPRPQAPQLRAADPQEDDPPRAALGPVRPGRRRQGRRGRRLGLRRPAAPSDGRRRRWPRSASRAGSLRRARRPRTHATPGRASATSATVHILEARRAQRLRRARVSDWVVFTERHRCPTAPASAREPSELRSRQAEQPSREPIAKPAEDADDDAMTSVKDPRDVILGRS